MEIPDELKRDYRFKILDDKVEFYDLFYNTPTGWYVQWFGKHLQLNIVEVFVNNDDYNIGVRISIDYDGTISVHTVDNDWESSRMMKSITAKMKKYTKEFIKEKTLDEFISLIRILINAIERLEEFMNNFEIVKPYKRIV